MKKENKILAAIVVILCLTAAYFMVFTNKDATIAQDRRDFAVEDTAVITQIFLADKDRNTVLLSRQDNGSWTLNKNLMARKDLVQVLLKTIKTLEVKSLVGRAAKENVIKRLSTSAIKVEIYMAGDEKPSKVYYVGGATQNSLGTYMLLENSSEPYIMQIPYFSGYLTTRYTTDVNEWRSLSIMNYAFKDLQEVSITYSNDSPNSFAIRNMGNWSYELISIPDSMVVPRYDTTSLRIYLTYFEKINYEGIVVNRSAVFKDSVFQSMPLLTMECRDSFGNTTQIKAYLKKLNEERFDHEGNQIVFDPDRLYAEINNSGELLTIQYYVFDKLFLRLNDFIPGPG